jgi:tRNA threonylcarbamoyladenosine biosynthesis protein TsaB
VNSTRDVSSGSASEAPLVGIDTASAGTAVAATRGDEVLYETWIDPAGSNRPLHASQVLPAVERAAGAAGGWPGVGRIAVGTGPGSFTGLRIGIATARALAQALEIPLVGVGSLEALARGMNAGSRLRLAVFDARRGEVFAALFDLDGTMLWEPLVCPPAELAERIAELPGPLLAAGDGALRFRRELSRAGGVEIPADADPVHRVAARHICAIGAIREPAEPLEIVPTYLRAPDAERWRERDKRKRSG